MLSDQDLIFFNSQGLIPGPSESTEQFSQRAKYCRNLKLHLSDQLKATLEEEASTPEILEEVKKPLRIYFDMFPEWVPLFFCNYQLPFWHGGSVWIFQVTENSPTAALIQMRKSFKQSKRYLKLYERKDLLAHECAHIGRMVFKEPRYEEYFAYLTSESKFRRFFGPFFQSSKETVLFVLLFGLIFIFDSFLLSTNRIEAYWWAFWLKSIPLALIGLGLLRLWKRHRTLRTCIERLKHCIKNPSQAEAVAYRLTDREIDSFSRFSPDAIRTYAFQLSQQELRWKMIEKIYFAPR